MMFLLLGTRQEKGETVERLSALFTPHSRGWMATTLPSQLASDKPSFRRPKVEGLLNGIALIRVTVFYRLRSPEKEDPPL